MTNGGSKGSKSEKQAEGETELSWDHEGLEPYPGLVKPKPQRSPKGTKLPEKEVVKRVTPKVCAKCKRNHDEKDCNRISTAKIERKLPSPEDSKEVPEGDKENLGPKWNFQKEETVIDNDTKQWVDEQNKFWKEEEKGKEREKQKESIPRKFEPKMPVKILQRGKQSITVVPSQVHKRLKDDSYAQGQNYSWNKSCVKPEYWNGHRPGYNYGPEHGQKNKSWGQGNGYGKKYGTEDKKRQGRVHRASGTQGHTHYANHRSRESAKFTPSRGIGGGWRGDDKNGGDKGNGNRKKYRNTNYDLGDEDEEESDTEDSFELEITPQQLSQVTPGGGVLKLTLSKRKPLKITTRAPSGEPDPSQTRVKTVYDPKKEKGDQTGRGTINIAQTGLEQFRREEAPPIGGRQPLQEDEISRFNRTPGGQGGLDDKGSKRNGNDNGKPHGNGGPGGDGDPNGGGGPGENGEPPRRGGKEPPGRNGESGGGDGGSDPSDYDGGGDGSSSPSSDTTPPRRRRHRRPRFVYVVQGPPGPPGQMGQPGQAERDGRDGQAPQLTRALEALRAQRGNLDTTGLENSFDYFGKTMTEVLNAQQRANRNLEEQFRKANETQESQVEAMQDMAQVN